MEMDQALDKVRKLINKAEHPDTDPAEAKIYRAKADAMMLQYAIREASLNAARPEAERSKPGKLRLDMCELGSPFKQELMHLCSVLCSYTRTKFVMHGYTFTMNKKARDYYRDNELSPGYIKLTVYGFESDLRYFEFLWTILNLHLANGLEIDYDFSKSMEENTYVMHNAGYNWLDIARAYGWEKVKHPANDAPGVKEPWRLRAAHDGIEAGTISPATMVGSRFKRAYYREIGSRGEDRLSIPASSRVVFQVNFIHAYWVRVQQRLDEAASRRATGSALVLASSLQAVRDMFNEENPKIKDAKEQANKYNEEGWRRGVAHANTADLDGAKVQTTPRKAVK